MKDLLVLDFDGVVTKIELDWYRVRREISSILNIKIESFTRFFEENFGTITYKLVSDLLEKYEREALQNAKPYPDVEPTVKLFQGNSIIATMQTETLVIEFLEKYNLRSYFRKILGRNRFCSKASQLSYIKSVFGDQYNRIIFIDDSIYNYNLCITLGLQCYLIRREKGDSLYTLIMYEVK